jgi:drug/metabolite transporter (DMT)-like permease
MANSPSQVNIQGVVAALATPLFLGLAPIFGKFALQSGADAFTVAALRTMVSVAVLWVSYALFFRKYIFIYPAGLMGCIVIGIVNGIGSLFYYGGLQQLDASMVQLINGSYLAFAMLLSRIGGQKLENRTIFRVLMAMSGLVMITGFGIGSVTWIGVGFMLANALMFAGTVILSQYVLYEMPAPTAALYILTTMGVVVTMVWLAVAPPLTVDILQDAGWAIFILGVTTALSRLAMFASVKFLGGIQTAIMSAAEIGIALLFAFLLLDDSLAGGQWAGVALLIISILLIRQKDLLPHGFNPNSLIVANMASVQFQRIAFHRAFGTSELDNSENTMGTLTTQEMIAIQRMMGAESGGIDPFPIAKSQLILGVSEDYDPYAMTKPATRAPERNSDHHTTETRPTASVAGNSTEIQEFMIPEELMEDED